VFFHGKLTGLRSKKGLYGSMLCAIISVPRGFLVHKWDFLCKIVSVSLQDLYLGPGIKDYMETYMCFSEIIPYINIT